MAPAFDVFLSHNGQDKPAVEHIAERLRRSGMTPWLDKWELTPGGRWQDELHAGLQDCRAFAYFLGPNGEGDWAREELDAARSRAAKDREFRIFPVLLPGTPDPFDRTTMPPFLGHRTWVDLRAGLDDPTGLQAFLNAIKGVPLGAPEEAIPVAGADDAPPYRGLDAFDEADAAFFFGREPDIQQLLERLKGGRFLAVLGPSGSGKSSLVRAGLVPALRHGAMPASDRWPVEIVKPGARPAEAIAARLLSPGSGGAAPATTTGLTTSAVSMQATLDGLFADARTLHLATTLALGDDTERRLVWVIDQAEELFTLCHDDAERSAVIDNLTYAASVPGGRAIVVLAMRADFYARAAAHADLAAHIARSQHLVAPLTPDGIRDAIEEPARAVGLVFEEGLVGTILDDLEGQPGSLPLLQYALLELWKRRRGGMLTLEGYRESGGVMGAIAKRAEAIYAAFTPDEQAIVRRALLRLTQPGEGTEDTRRRASMRELVTRVDEAGEVQAVIGELTDARLLTASADPSTGEGLVDISHEALIRAWPRVREWLDEDRAGQRVLRRITESSAEWVRLARDEGLLFRGVRLAEAVEWREEHEALLNDDERAFLDTSAALQARERAARERARRRVTVAAGVLAAVFLVLAGLAGLQWLSAESERRTAEDQRAQAEDARRVADQRAAEADEQRQAAETARAEAEIARAEALGRALAFQAEETEATRDRALLLALEASRRSDAPEVRSLLLRALTTEPRLVRYAGAIGPAVAWVDVRGDPPRVAWVDVEGTLRVADLSALDRPLLQLVVPGGSGAGVALSPDGATVAASAGQEVATWDVASGRQRWRTRIDQVPIAGRLAFVAGEEPVLAVAGSDGSVHLLDLDTGAYVRQTLAPEVPLEGALALNGFGFTFAPDGARLARGEQDGRVGIWSTLDGTALVGPIDRNPPAPPLVDPPHTTVDLAWMPRFDQVGILYNDGIGLMVTEPTPMTTGPLTAGVLDGLRIAFAGKDGGFLVGSANRGLRYLSFAALSQLAWESVGMRPFPYAMDVTDAEDLVVAGYPDGRLAVYDMGAHWQLAERLPIPTPPSGPATLDQAYAIRRDGEAYAWYEQASAFIRVADRAGAPITELSVGASFVEAIALGDDGTRLVAVEVRGDAPTYDSWLVERRLPDGEVLLERHLGPWGFDIALSPDGERVLVGDARGGLSLQGLEGGEVIWSAPVDADRRAISAVELSPDGRTVRAGANVGSGPFGRAVLLTYGVDDPPGTPPGSVTVDTDRIAAVATTPDGERLFLAANDAQSWSDGRLLVMRVGEDGTSGSMGPPGDNIAVLRFDPDGRLLSGGPVAGWFAWNVDPAEWERRACAIAARDLTQAEWRDALGDEPWAPTCSAAVVPGDGPAEPSPEPGGSIEP